METGPKTHSGQADHVPFTLIQRQTHFLFLPRSHLSNRKKNSADLKQKAGIALIMR